MSVQNTNLNPTTQTGAEASVQGANRSRQAQEARSAHRVAQSNGSGAAAARATDSSQDNVQLSGAAQQIQTLKAAANADSPEHSARVDAVAKSYAAGTYTPDPHATAVGIVSDAVENHGRK